MSGLTPLNKTVNKNKNLENTFHKKTFRREPTTIRTAATTLQSKHACMLWRHKI